MIEVVAEGEIDVEVEKKVEDELAATGAIIVVED